MKGSTPITPTAAITKLLATLAITQWNAIIPKCALRVQEDGSSIKYLHPTKGWRWVNKRRLKVLA